VLPPLPLIASEQAPPSGTAERCDARRLPGPAFAALDLGTNNCRMLIGTPCGAGFRVIDSFSRVVRLGEGLHLSGRLSDCGMDRALAALQGCAERLARRPVRGLRAVATEACRQAANGAEFLCRAKAETGLPLELISPREEATLALESCAALLAGAARRALVFDIGGGSTELAWVRIDPCGPPVMIGYLSVPVGVVTLAERFGSAADTAAGFSAMVADIAGRLAGFEQIHCIAREIRQGDVRLLGTSGTVTTLAGQALGLPRYHRALVDGTVLSSQAADDALDRLRTLGRNGLRTHPCIGPERAEFVLPGCAIFVAIRQTWPAPHIIVADRGLREGMLLRLIQAHRGRRG
jgi:exopolyphosphatase / guanosine-5'-triphosphate,3'-diphosphate pyrophosphatase